MGELLPLQRLETLREKEPGWTFPDLAGRLVELSAAIPSAELTLAFGLVKDAQREGEPAAWIAARSDSFFPPDVAGSGIDLASLAVVKVKTPAEALRAADKLTRSGAFGLLVMDLGRDPVLPPPLLSRLLSLALKHGTALIALTEKAAETPSVSSLVSLRALVGCRRVQANRFACEAQAVKDKRRAPGWTHLETVRGPSGLR